MLISLFHTTGLSLLTENIQQPLVFWCVLRVRKEISGMSVWLPFSFNLRITFQQKLSIHKKHFEKNIMTHKVKLSKGCRATMRRQFTINYLVSRSFWYLFDRPWKDERLSWPGSHPVVLKFSDMEWSYCMTYFENILRRNTQGQKDNHYLQC